MKDIRDASIDEIIDGLTEHSDSIISEFQENKLRKRDVDWNEIFDRIGALGYEYNLASYKCDEILRAPDTQMCTIKVNNAYDIEKQKVLKWVREYCK